MTGNSKIVSVENLSISFKNDESENVVVHGVNFDLYKGETLGVVGESGSGKSVTSMSFLKLLPSSASYPTGNIWFYDKTEKIDLLSLEEKDIRRIRGKRIAMIFQNPMNSLNPTHRCGAQVEEAILLHHSISKTEAKARVIELFGKVKLRDPERIYDSYPHQLSGGQIQRIMIAMAVSCNPDVLIADEPTTALDVTVQKSILTLLDEIKKAFNTTVIFISHDLGVIHQIADRVIVMKKGEIVESGNTKTIFSSAKHAYTKGLINCRPPLNTRIDRLPTVEDYYQDEVPKLKEISRQSFNQRIEDLKQAKELLKVEHLKKYYVKSRSFLGKPIEWTKAVDDVSFVMNEGETLGLVGESGSGKSTLGKTILRLIDSTDGQVHFKGMSVFELPKKELKTLRRDFQIVFQNPYGSLNPRMKIGKAIMEPMTVHNLHGSKNDRKNRSVELLEMVGLEADHWNRYPHQFSGGQRQRICIARTLSLNPKFIVCDESVSALDVSIQAQILNLLKDLKQQFNLSYLFISHDLSVIKHISDNVIVMQHGKIVERNNAENLFSNPQEEYTQRLLEAIPRV